MRKRKIKDSIDEISQELLIKQTKKKIQQKKLRIVLPETQPKKKQKKNKSKGRN